MKRRMEPANPESKFKKKDAGMLAAKPTTKKADKADVTPTGRVPKGKGREAFLNKRI